MITYLATPRHLTAPVAAPRLTLKAFIRRVFELSGAPYAHTPYQPL